MVRPETWGKRMYVHLVKSASLLSTSKPDVAASRRVVIYTGIPRIADTPGMMTQKHIQHGHWDHVGKTKKRQHSKTHRFEHSAANYLM